MLAKYITVYEPIGDGTKDRGENRYCLECSDEGLRKATGVGSRNTVENFPLRYIERVDCFRGDELHSNTASGAAAGLLIGGARGAVIGGMLSSGSTKAWWIEVELTDHSVHHFRCDRDSDHDTFLKWAKSNRVNVKAAEITETPAAGSSEADEILKFKNLLDQGIITQEEFNAKKKQLLGL